MLARISPMYQVNLAGKYFENFDLLKKQAATAIEKHPENPDTQQIKYMVRCVGKRIK